ncbi:MAG TPA: FlgD immunoglobulin-like domain containing protein [bacterium]|nr:FlgD immunoglobulin-like domain containing protein [bacterium]
MKKHSARILLLIGVLISMPASAVTLLTPNGGEQWRSGTSKKITWSTLLTDSVRLEYQVRPADGWVLIATDIPAQDLSYAWLVPALESDSCRVRVSEVGNEAVFDVSDTTFIITQVVQTTEVEPNGTAYLGNWMEYGDSLLAAIDPLGDVDYYRFWGAANDTIVIWGHERNDSDLGGRIFLYRADGASLTTNSGYLNPPYDQRIVWILPQDGIYYVRYAQSTDWGTFPNRELVERLEQENWENLGKDLTTIQWDSSGDYTIGVRKLEPGGPVILLVEGLDYYWDSARFRGYVDTKGLPTTVRFEYGLTGDFDQSVVPEGGPFSSAGPMWIESPMVDSLQSNTFYYMRMQATNALGTSISAPYQFTTLPPSEGWERKISGFNREFRDLHFMDENTGVIVGDSLVIRTTDGGETWSSVYPGTAWINFRGVYFPSATVGYAFGSYDHVAKTTNSGATWSLLGTGSGHYLNNGFFVTDLLGWVITDAGGITKTTDGGVTWTMQSSGTGRQLFGIHFVNADTGMVVGDRIILRTTNGGANWTTVHTDSTGLFRNVTFVTPQLGIIVGDKPWILRTNDGGLTWSPITLSAWSAQTIWDAKFYSEETVLAVGWMGTIYRSVDGGLTWEYQQSGTMNNLYALSHAGGRSTIIGRNQAILRSVDFLSLREPNGGESWSAGSVQDIVWWSDLSGESTLEYRIGRNGAWTPIAAVVPTASESYSWTLPTIETDSCKVRITTLPSGAFSDESDGYFSITAAAPAQHTIYLNPGWNMISSWMAPTEPAMDSVMADIVARGHLTILKNISGMVYWPELAINLIGDWNPLEGYQCYVSATDSLSVVGQQQTPELTPMALDAGWRMVAYLRNNPLNAEAALASIGANLVIAKNGTGMVYWPELSINMIGDMLPGQGYQIYLNAASTLTYPANDTILPKKRLLAFTRTRPVLHFQPPHRMTGSNAILLVKAPHLRENDEIAVADSDGKIVGASAVQDGRAVITIWGDDRHTEAIDGCREGEALRLLFWSADSSVESTLPIVSVQNALNGTDLPAELFYRENAVWVAQAADLVQAPKKFALRQNYPNPFNPTTSIRFELPHECSLQLVIYNLRGQAIRTLAQGKMKAGYHDIIWEGRDQSGEQVASGVYLVRMQAGSFVQVIKISLIK